MRNRPYDWDVFSAFLKKGQWFMIWPENWGIVFRYCPQAIRLWPKELLEKWHWEIAVSANPALAAESPFQFPRETNKDENADAEAPEAKADEAAATCEETEAPFDLNTENLYELGEYISCHPEELLAVYPEREWSVPRKITIFSYYPALAQDRDWKEFLVWGLNRKRHDQTIDLWKELLMRQPQFSEICPYWEELGSVQAYVLEKRPELAEKLPIQWDLFDWEWIALLEKQPQLFKYCDWKNLDYNVQEDIFSNAYKFLPYIDDLSALPSDAWSSILRKDPSYITQCSKETLEDLSLDSILLDNREIYRYFKPKDFQCWDCIVKTYPDLLTDCPWDDLSSQTLGQMLITYPEYVKKVNLSHLDGEAWVSLLYEHPEFSPLCHWGKLTGNDWIFVMFQDRKYEAKCCWGKLNGANWESWLSVHPEYFSKCPVRKLKKWDWVRLMVKQPQLGKYCPFWKTFTYDHWIGILKYHGEYAWLCPEKLRPRLEKDWFWKAADQWHLDHPKLSAVKCQK